MMTRKDYEAKNKKEKRRTRWGATLFFTGFILLLLGTGTDDARTLTTSDKEREALAKPAETYTMIGTGLAALLGSAVLLRTRNKSR